MNKKTKITLLSLMLGVSLTGVATTIVSCSASSSNELKIERSSSLEMDLTNSLTEILKKDQDYLSKKETYNNILDKNELPESTLSILKNGIKFINNGNDILWDDAVTKLEINGSPFTQVAKGTIKGISIKLTINSDYVVSGSSSAGIEVINTRALGNIGSINISNIELKNPGFNDKLANDLTRILEDKKTYQEMKQTYDSWIKDPLKNLPTLIINDFVQNFIFELEDKSQLSFLEIVDNIKFEPESEYPKGVNQKVPNFKTTIILKEDGDGEDDYTFSNPSQKDLLTIPEIEINAETKAIDTNFTSSNIDVIENEFLQYLNKPNADNYVLYQEVKQKFENMIGENKIIPDGIKDAISQNFNFPNYDHGPISFDDVVEKITITSNGEFPKNANAPLPNITISLTPKPNFVSTNSSLINSFEINLSKVKSGIIRYEVVISQNLEKDLNNVLSSHLYGLETWQDMKSTYDDSWNTFENLPQSAQSLIKNGITFIPIGLKSEDLDSIIIEKSTSFENIIDNISLIKGQFPSYGNEIPSINFKLTMIDDAFHSDDYQRDINIKSGGLGKADKPISTIIIINNENILQARIEIQKLIDNNLYSENFNTYNSWKKISDLPTNIIDIIKESVRFDANQYPDSFKWDDIVDKNNEAEFIKPNFPNQPSMPINDFSLRVYLDSKFILNNSSRSFDINFGQLFCKGYLEIKPVVKEGLDPDIEKYFTDYLNKYLIEGLRPNASVNDRLNHMRDKYKSIEESQELRRRLFNDISYINMTTNTQINIAANNFFTYFDVQVKLGSFAATYDQRFGAVEITLTVKDGINFFWSSTNNKIRKIKTDALKSAKENIPTITKNL
ncbi:MAG: hypothetical protein ACRDCD_01215 [Mycoplasmoidaceae bacterium]